MVNDRSQTDIFQFPQQSTRSHGQLVAASHVSACCPVNVSTLQGSGDPIAHSAVRIVPTDAMLAVEFRHFSVFVAQIVLGTRICNLIGTCQLIHHKT